METEFCDRLIGLRAAVGYLGEQGHFGWWPSSFFVAGSTGFLAPVFPRTHTLAQVTGVSRAAARSHDERIGVGNSYHLFRLPEEIEQAIHRRLLDAQTHQSITQRLTDRDAARAWLAEMAAPAADTAVGPIRIDGLHGVYAGERWSLAAAHYLAAFTNNNETYPYFTDSAL